MKEIDYAYLAGYIDGDGCFYIDTVKAKTGPFPVTHRTVLKFASVDISIMQWLKKELEIHFWEKPISKNMKHLNRRIVYEANLTGESLDKVLPKILPYLRIKKLHCEIMIKMRSTYAKPTKGIVRQALQESIFKFRQTLHKELSSLNTHKLLNPSASSP